MTESGTVTIIDDDQDVSVALERLLTVEGYLVNSYTSAQVFLDAYDPSRPGCIILDLIMPEMNGLEVQRRLINSGCAPSIVFLSGTGDVRLSVRAMKDGAIDFLTKPVNDEALLQVVRQAIEKDRANRQKLRDKESIEQKRATLTPREREVLDLVVQGKMNKEIAVELGVMEQTVKVHRGHGVRKMGAQSVADLVRIKECIGSFRA